VKHQTTFEAISDEILVFEPNLVFQILCQPRTKLLTKDRIC